MRSTNKLNKVIWLLITQTILKLCFAEISERAILFFPLQIDNPRSISIGKKVFISNDAWIAGGKDSGEVTLRIDDYTRIGHFFHCIGLHNVHIGKSVLIADKVFISDSSHRFEDVSIPVFDQGMEQLKAVNIGDESWIGENVSILGASVGRHCVIGANSVVTRDIPDYCVAVGSPAKVIKRYDPSKQIWIPVNKGEEYE